MDQSLDQENEKTQYNWRDEIQSIVNSIDKEEFPLEEIYAFENDLRKKFPDNHHIKAKIRQQLQLLRDDGLLEFSDGGIYKKTIKKEETLFDHKKDEEIVKKEIEKEFKDKGKIIHAFIPTGRNRKTNIFANIWNDFEEKICDGKSHDEEEIKEIFRKYGYKDSYILSMKRAYMKYSSSAHKYEMQKQRDVDNKHLTLYNFTKRAEEDTTNEREPEDQVEVDTNWFEKGLGLAELKQYDKAIKCYDKALEIDSGDANIWNSKGVALDHLEKYEEAIKCYDKALEIDPNDEILWYNKGYLHDALGQYTDAILSYDKALEINPKDADTWYKKGDAMENLKHYDLAIKCYDKSLKLEPDDANIWNSKGVALDHLEKYEEAIKCYDKSLKLEPGDNIVISNRKRAYENLRNYELNYKGSGETEIEAPDKWATESELKKRYRYNVKSGTMTWVRQRNLERAVEGMGLEAVVNHISSMVRLNMRRNDDKMEDAIRKWKEDLEWLKEKYYYGGRYRFRWPTY